MSTPVKGLKIGDNVIVHGLRGYGTRKIVALYAQISIPGGVILDRPVDLFRSWNEDVLDLVPVALVMKPQHQGSLFDQQRELIQLANKEGLYDAADWLTQLITEVEIEGGP